MIYCNIKSLHDSIKRVNRSVISGRKIINAFKKIPNSPAGQEKLYSEQKKYISVLEEKCKLLNNMIIEQKKQIEELKLNNKRSSQQIRYAYGKENKSNAASE